MIPQTKIFAEEEFAWFFIKLVSITLIIPLTSVLIMYKNKMILEIILFMFYER